MNSQWIEKCYLFQIERQTSQAPNGYFLVNFTKRRIDTNGTSHVHRYCA